MTLGLSVYIFSLVCVLFLGIIIYRSQAELKAKEYFSYICFATAFWVVCLIIADNLKDYNTVFLASKLAVIGPVWIPAFFVLLSTVFPLKTKETKLVYKLLFLVPVAIFSVIAPLGSFAVETVKIEEWGANVTPGVLYTYLLFIFLVYFFVAIYNFIKKLKYTKSEQQKAQVYLILIGLVIASMFGLVTNLVLVMLGISNFGFLGPPSVLIFVGFIAYAVLKHHLMNIKVILVEVAVVVVAMASFSQILTSVDLLRGIINALIFLVVVYGGHLLVKSVQQEIKRREQIQALASRLDKANQRLEELDEIKDNFMSMASHELNTPISAIEGYLSMILDEKMGGELNGIHKKYLTSVYASAKRLAALVRDLLNVSRIESNRIHLIYEESQMEDIISQAVMEVGSKVKEMNHTLTFDKPSAPLPKTWFDKTRIIEVLINLIGNSIKYTEPGGKIEVKTWHEGNTIVTSVKDNGRGIPKEKLSHVFEKFSQVNVLKDQVKGTGLGLFISKNLVELHKGKIWFESEGEGKGTTFYFSLPVLKEKPRDEHEGEGAVIELKSTPGASVGAPAGQNTGKGSRL